MTDQDTKNQQCPHCGHEPIKTKAGQSEVICPACENNILSSKTPKRETKQPLGTRENPKPRFKPDVKTVLFSALFFLILLYVLKPQTESYTLENIAGTTYRLNTKNGDIALIEHNFITSLQKPSNNLPENIIKEWDEITIPSKDKNRLTLATKWRAGKLYYRFGVTPYQGRLQSFYENNAHADAFEVYLIDKDKFTLLRIPIQTNDLTRIIDDENKIGGMRAEGTIECSLSTYSEITDWVSSWRIDG